MSKAACTEPTTVPPEDRSRRATARASSSRTTIVGASARWVRNDGGRADRDGWARGSDDASTRPSASATTVSVSLSPAWVWRARSTMSNASQTSSRTTGSTSDDARPSR